MSYAKLAASGRIIPSIEHCGELQWKLRYAQDSLTTQDMLHIAHYMSQYAAFHEYTNKQRNDWFKEYKLVWETEQ